MIKKLKVLLILCLSLSVLLLAVSCGEYRVVEFENLSFSIPKKMRKTADEKFDICYTTMECMLGVQIITEEILSVMELSSEATLEEVTDAFITRNGIDKNQCSLSYDENAEAYKLRYSISFDGEAYYFHYIVIIGEGKNMYFVDMSCDYENSSYYLIEFEKWGKTVSLK